MALREASTHHDLTPNEPLICLALDLFIFSDRMVPEAAVMKLPSNSRPLSYCRLKNWYGKEGQAGSGTRGLGEDMGDQERMKHKKEHSTNVMRGRPPQGLAQYRVNFSF